MSVGRRNVTIQDLGSIGELVAALATLATLVYLAIQIRGNTIAVRSQSRRGAVANTLAAASTIGSNKETASIFRRGIGNFESLDSDEQLQFSFLMGMLVAEADAAFVDFELGITDSKEFESTSSTVQNLLRTPGGREYWRGFGSNTTPGFRSYVETQVFDDAGGVGARIV